MECHATACNAVLSPMYPTPGRCWSQTPHGGCIPLSWSKGNKCGMFPEVLYWEQEGKTTINKDSTKTET